MSLQSTQILSFTSVLEFDSIQTPIWYYVLLESNKKS